MDLGLAGRMAVVTGGSQGIGAAIVRTFAAEGCHVAFCARHQEGIDAMVRSVEAAGLPGKVTGRALDVADAGAFRAWVEGLGAVDVFVPNVSAISGDWGRAWEVDVRGTVAATEAIVPVLERSGCGAITYVGTKETAKAGPGFEAYGASKAAVVHYMKSLSRRLLPKVRVNVVSPGDTEGDGATWDRIKAGNPAGYAEGVRRNPMGRLGRSDEVARVVVFVSSPAASFVAGANWYVDGGSMEHVQM